MIRLGVVIPTVPARDELLARTMDAYRERAEAEAIDLRFAVVRGAPSIGQGWNQGADSLRDWLNPPPHPKNPACFLHLSADDVEPAEDALTAAMHAAADGLWPSPRILNPDGSLLTCGTLGQGWLIEDDVHGPLEVASSQFPMMRAGVWGDVGPAPPVHYYADDALGWQARWSGLPPTYVPEYVLTHLEETAANPQVVAHAMAHRAQAMQQLIGRESVVLG